MDVAPVYPVLSEMNLRQVHEEISVADSELTMAWCRRYGLLKTERTSMRCRNEMRLVARSGVDGKIWQCGSPCRARVSVCDQLRRSNNVCPHEFLMINFNLERLVTGSSLI